MNQGQRLVHIFLIHNNGCMNFFLNMLYNPQKVLELAQIYPVGDLSRWFQRCCDFNGYKFTWKVGGTVAGVACQSSKIGISLKVASSPFWNEAGDVNTSDKGTLSNTLCGFSHLILATAVLPMGFPGGTSGKELAYHCRRHKRRGFDSWVGKIPWRRAWQPTPVSLPGESHGRRGLVSYSPKGRKKSDTTEVT